MKKYNIVVSGISIVIGLAVLYLSKDFPKDFYGSPGEGFWPGIVAWILIGLGLFLSAGALFGKQDADPTSAVDFSSPPVKMAYLIAGVSFAYAACILLLGFLGATFLFLPVSMWLLREKSLRFIALVTLGTIAASYLVFELILESPLATSVFFG